MSGQRISDQLVTNKALIRRFVNEIINHGNLRLLPELVAADHISHTLDGDLYGPEGVRLEIAELRAAFPDVAVVIKDLIAEVDRVSRRFVIRGTHRGPFLGFPATNRDVVVSGLALHRLANGKLVESWLCLNTLDLMGQLGARPYIAQDGGR